MKTARLASMEEQAARLYDKFSGTYDNDFSAPHRHLYDEIAWELVYPILNNSRRHNSVLDAGGGTGRWAIRLAKENFHVTLYDISPRMCSVATRKVRQHGLDDHIKIVEADFAHIHPDDGPFDFIIAMGALQYSSRPDEVVREWTRVLRPGGGMAVLVDSKFARASWMLTHSGSTCQDVMKLLDNEQKNGFSANGEKAVTHVFSPLELSNLMRDNGLKVKVTAGLLALWPNLDNQKLHARLEADFQAWKEFELKYCQEPSIAGIGRQILVIAQKPKVER